MAKLDDFGKETFFEKNGFTWDSRIEGYVNRDNWKIFSKDYIDDHSFDQLLGDIEEDATPGSWKVYYNVESPFDIHNLKVHYGVSPGGVIK